MTDRSHVATLAELEEFFTDQVSTPLPHRFNVGDVLDMIAERTANYRETAEAQEKAIYRGFYDGIVQAFEGLQEDILTVLDDEVWSSTHDCE